MQLLALVLAITVGAIECFGGGLSIPAAIVMIVGSFWAGSSYGRYDATR